MKALIKKYQIKLVGEDKIGCNPAITSNKSDLGFMKSHKAQIIEILKEEKNAAKKACEERLAKIKAIEGLEEIQNAIADMNAWHNEFEKSFGDVGGLGVRPKPSYDFDDLRKKYPRAAAYLRATDFAEASNYAKAKAGKKAIEKIINGEDYEKALADMQTEWDTYCEEHMFD
jgi:hypothetical protein